MEDKLLGKNIVKYNEDLIEKTYQTIYQKRLKYHYIYMLVVGLLGILLILGDLFIEYFHTFYPGLFFLFLVLFVFIQSIKLKKIIQNMIYTQTSVNKNKEITVSFYEDKIHLYSIWDNGESKYTIDYSNISDIYIRKDFSILLFYGKTQFLIMIEDTLEGVTKYKIIDKIKAENPNLNIYYVSK